jgi:hypothetical protein
MLQDRRTDRQTDGQTDGRTDRQTNVTKVIVAFRNFANAPKKAMCVNVLCYKLYSSLCYYHYFFFLFILNSEYKKTLYKICF